MTQADEKNGAAKQDAEVAASAGGIFKDPQVLSSERHGDLRLRKVENGYGFARQQHLVPVTAHEIPQMATQFPIVFVGPKHAPCAVMGLRENINLFVSPEGAMTEGVDAPAALRQYPFFSQRDPSNENMALCIDRAAPQFSETEGEKLFDGEGPSQICQTVMQFLGTLDQQWRVTTKFAKTMEKLELFETKELTGREPAQSLDKRRAVASYVTIDEKKLANLAPKDRTDLTKSGFLPVCYAILISQHNWRNIMRLAVRHAEAQKG